MNVINILNYIFWGLLLVSGARLLYPSVTTLALGAQSSSWPITNGRIVSSETKQGYSTKLGSYYIPAIRYEYKVNNTIYTSSVISLVWGSDYRRYRFSLEKVQSEYPLGKMVEVHYNPDRPEIAALDTRVTIGSLTPLIAGTVCFVGGLIGLLASLA